MFIFIFMHLLFNIRREWYFLELFKSIIFLVRFHLRFILCYSHPSISLFNKNHCYLCIFSLPRYGIGQHDRLWPVGRVHKRECQRSPSEEAPSSEWEKVHQPDSPCSIFCRYRQETFWPSLAWKEWWDKLWHSFFANTSTLMAFQCVTISIQEKKHIFSR